MWFVEGLGTQRRNGGMPTFCILGHAGAAVAKTWRLSSISASGGDDIPLLALPFCIALFRRLTLAFYCYTAGLVGGRDLDVKMR